MFLLTARELLTQRLEAVREALAAAVRSDAGDTEPAHRVRVAARRAAAALDFFRPLLPRSARKLRATIVGVRHTADAARDCDVLAERLATDHADMNFARAACASARKAAQAPIRAAWEGLCDAETFRREADAACVGLRSPGKQGSCQPGSCDEAAGLRWISRRVGRSVRRFQRASRRRQWTPERLHRLRIRGKTLRYVLELVRPFVAPPSPSAGPLSVPPPGSPASPAVPRPQASSGARVAEVDVAPVCGGGPSGRLEDALRFLEELQERLGALNDFTAGERLLRAWRHDARADAERAELRRLRREERRRRRRETRRFERWWTARRRRRELRRLERVAR